MPEEPKVHEIVVKVYRAEMAVRIGEALFDITRPEGRTASEALAALSPASQDRLNAASEAVMMYFYECNQAALGDAVQLRAYAVPADPAAPPPGEKVH